ncbi:DUF2339 domain-containing protein [Burkholderia sp. AU19243]|uniref:DUF2339 domain-containing protein n=1 Tax=Burkholderia sp. AU19243 TaxID=2824810 RepID=UPI001B9F6EAB|nr:DUF2339 domain-containing protein [Burkholderia sp. AU19243]MBR8364341.1 DUF2339 domain-containing protein [Burkholderia sp. AU19243]
MNWAFAAIGFIVGGIAALFGDFPAASGMLLGAALGFAIGRVLQQRNRESGGAATGTSAMPPAPPPVPLAERVARLETTVDALTRELDMLRTQLAGTQVTATAASGAAPAPSTTPAATPPFPVAQPAAASAGTASSISTPAPTQPFAARASEGPAAATAAVTAAAEIDARATTEHPATAQPREPGIVERALQAARDWLLGGNTVVRVGVIVLFFGVAFLLKYAADNDMLPIEFRLAGTALAAGALLAIGWRVRARRAAYGLVLQGGGVGILYLTIFAATKLYALLPVGAAFPLMVAVCALSAFLAVKQNALPLAFMGSAGGFLAPVLLSTGHGSHIALFSYYALLNAGIFAIAWFKAWRPLNLLGFVFTFTIGSAWGVTAYRPELFATTEPFLILFFLMYAGIALLYAIKRELALRHYVDGTLVFGTPIVATALQASLVKDMPFALAWSAVALSAFYVAVAAWLSRRRDRLGLLFESMLALAAIFATLAVPLAFSGPTTSAAWAIEGAAVVWLGVRQKRVLAFGFGLAMQLAAAGAFFTSLLGPADTNALPVLNSGYIAMLLIALAGLFTGWWLHGRGEARAWHPWMPDLGIAAAAWGLLWWLSGGLHEILVYASRHVDLHADRFVVDATALFAAATAWLAHVARRKLAWPIAEWPALALTPVLALLALRAFDSHQPPLSGIGAFAWPAAVIACYALLLRQSRGAAAAGSAAGGAGSATAGAGTSATSATSAVTSIPTPVIAPLHTLMFWTLCGLCSLEGFWRLRAFVPEGAWSWSAWAYGFGALLLLVSGPGSRLRWPVAAFPRAYQLWGAAPLAALLWLWSIASTASDGDASPLLWLPLLNPLDVAQLLIFVAFAAWLRRVKTLDVNIHPLASGLAVLAIAFLWFNALLLRTLHHWTGVPYTVEAMAASTLVQASVSVYWTLCALATTIWATRRGLRPLWFVGAALLALTVIKLFLFDLSHVTGIERIVSFIGIGVLLLLIGYFSPLPPKAAAPRNGTRP